MKWFSGNAQRLAFIPISGGCCGVITTLRPFGCPQGREDTAPSEPDAAPSCHSVHAVGMRMDA